uniref:Uncharacterized protein n=1 Tax=Leptocylindrus danicus TaxID=163516 RepID=A0A7S2K4F7_9STRA
MCSGGLSLPISNAFTSACTCECIRSGNSMATGDELLDAIQKSPPDDACIRNVQDFDAHDMGSANVVANNADQTCHFETYKETTSHLNDNAIAHDIISKQKEEIAALQNRVNDLTSALAELSMRRLEESKLTTTIANDIFHSQQSRREGGEIEGHSINRENASVPSNASILSPITAPTFFSPQNHGTRSKTANNKVHSFGSSKLDYSTDSSFEGEMVLSVQTASAFKQNNFSSPKPESAHDEIMMPDATLPKIRYSMSQCDSDDDEYSCQEGPSIMRIEAKYLARNGKKSMKLPHGRHSGRQRRRERL